MSSRISGDVVYMYAFDVADEIHTSKIQEILSKKPFPFEVRKDRGIPKDLPLYRPLAIETASLVSIGGNPVHVLIRVYDVGVVTLSFRVPFDVTRLGDLIPFHEPRLDSGKSLTQTAHELCGKVCEGIKPYLVRLAPSGTAEAFTVFCVSRIEHTTDATTWFNSERQNIAGLLGAVDPANLSDNQIAETTRVWTSYERSDFVVIDWDAALVVDLAAYPDDVLYVIELANLQTEEFRALDERLDKYLNESYRDLDCRSLVRYFIAPKIVRPLRRIRVDVAKLADEVTHITKFVGDWYLARVYMGAHARFHLANWHRSVEKRLDQLDELYQLVHAEINEVRMLWLEVIIVVLFIVDIAGLFFFKN